MKKIKIISNSLLQFPNEEKYHNIDEREALMRIVARINLLTDKINNIEHMLWGGKKDEGSSNRI